MMLSDEYKLAIQLANLYSSCKKEGGGMAAARVLFMVCTLDPKTSRILLLREDFIHAIQDEIVMVSDSANIQPSFEIVIFLYTELCAAAESEELNGDGRYLRPIQQLLSTTVRDRFFLHLSIDNDALVHASTYALVHLHTLSTARGASPGVVLAALPEQRCAVCVHGAGRARTDRSSGGGAAIAARLGGMSAPCASSSG
jgi:hypothetical protein